MMAEPSQKPDILSRLIHVTIWKSMAPREAAGGPTTLRKLAEAIENRHAPSKEDLWWLKLARFGTVKNEKGFLRHNDNLIECEGIEADYDGKKVSIDEAVEILEKANLGCLIYTSPSHTPEEPKWRILAPFSEPLDPAQRDHLMGRLNGLFGGIFDPASWTLSQSYYYGFVDGNEANHRVELIDGEPIDYLDDLDKIWMPKPLRSARFTDNEAHDSAYRRHAYETDLDLDAVYAAIESGANFHNAMLSLAGHLFGKDYTLEEVQQALIDVLERVPHERRDRRWKLRSSPRHLNSLLNWFSHRENKKMFKLLREREGREDDARVEPEPDAPPEPEQARTAPGAEAPPEPDKKEPKKSTATNALTLRRALKRFPEMGALVAFNELTLAPVLLKPIPDPDRKSNTPFQPRGWEDNDDVRLAMWFQSIGYLKATKMLAHDVMQIVAAENAFHPVRDYLAGLTWDGAKRLSTWLQVYCGIIPKDQAEADYTNAVSRAVLIGAVARATQPGCKVDTMMIMEGPQGARKSSAIRGLCAEPDWFSDTMPSDLDHKDARQHLRGNWLIEMSEISQLRKSEVESLKSFLSTQVDKYRPSHGRNEVSRPRQCLFIGTTNEDAYLIDATGNRRFWPVKAGEIDLSGLIEIRDQLWAEAASAYRSGECWWLEGEAAKYAMQAQDERMVSDEWETPIREYLTLHKGPVQIRQILKERFGMDDSMQNKVDQMRVSTALKRLGYQRVQKRTGGDRAWSWYPPE